MTSVSAGIASAYFTKQWCSNGGCAIFDSRVFNIPMEEMCNYFIWRQMDWIRNSVQMLAQAHFSHKQLHGKNQPAMHDMLHEIGVNWADLQDRWKNGVFIHKNECGAWKEDHSIIFKDDRCAVDQFTNQSDNSPIGVKSEK
jgi:tRNA(His) 5'-end guanylyltransferase